MSNATMTKVKKRGRPALPEEKVKGQIVRVRFDQAEVEKVASAAKASRQTVSEWVRSTLRANLEA